MNNQAKAIVLYTLSAMQCRYNSDKLFDSIERLQELHDRFPDDVILLRCFVKTLTVFNKFDYSYHTPQVLKKILKRAR